jgi:hypothetical protein
VQRYDTESQSQKPTPVLFNFAEGVLLYSLDEGLVFDPTDLGVEVTPGAVHAAAARGAWLQAFLLALRLNQPPLLRHVILSTPPKQVVLEPDLYEVQYARVHTASWYSLAQAPAAINVLLGSLLFVT